MLLEQIKQIFEWNDKVNELFNREFLEYNFEKLFQGMNIFNEEAFETIIAAIKWNKIEIADLIIDMAFGSENTEKIIQEIIDSNNTRFTDGCCIRDGKFIKGKEYRKPNFSFL